MLAKGSENSYSEDFRRKRTAEKLSHRADGGASSNLLTDRQAYISYLEVQLDRVTASCMTVQAFSDRIQQIYEHATSNESRLKTLTQELHLGLAERDRNLERMESFENKISERLDEFENRYKTLESQVKGIQFDVPDIEYQVQRLVKPKLDSILSEHENLEMKLTGLLNQHIDVVSQLQSDSERRLTVVASNHKGDLESVVRNTEKHLAISWERSMADLDERIEKLRQEVICEIREQIGINEIQHAREMQSKRLSQLQQQMSSLGPGIVDHINSLCFKLRSFEDIDKVRHQTMQNLERRVKSAEQICSRIAHDVLKKVELHRLENLQKLKDISGMNLNDASALKEEMCNEMHRWQEAMSLLIRNTESQMKKLVDTVRVQKQNIKRISTINENSSVSNICKRAENSNTPCKFTGERHQPPWTEILSNWKEQHHSSKVSLNTSLNATVINEEQGDNYCTNLKTISKTMEQLDQVCQREVDLMTSLGEPRRFAKQSKSYKRSAATKKAATTTSSSTPSLQATLTRRKSQSASIKKMINR